MIIVIEVNFKNVSIRFLNQILNNSIDSRPNINILYILFKNIFNGSLLHSASVLLFLDSAAVEYGLAGSA